MSKTTTLREDLDYAHTEERGPLCLANYQVQKTDVVYRTNHLHMRTFQENDAFLDDSKQFTDNCSHPGITLFDKSQENPAKSLLTTETLFLLKAIEDTKASEGTVVYIGGSPGDHLNILAQMFPELKFVVYDPHPMPKITETVNLVKREELFTDDHCSLFEKEEGALFMISDIRKKTYKAISDNMTMKEVVENAQIIVDDMESQRRWLKLMKPYFALMRFRPLMKKEAKALGQTSFVYPTGLHLLMPYSKVKTNSTMLMTHCGLPERTYYHKDFIDRLKWHNIVVRNSHVFMNPFTHTFQALLPLDVVLVSNIDFPTGFPTSHYVMNCAWDYRMVFFVFTLYLKRRHSQTSKMELYQMLTRFILEKFARMETPMPTVEN